MKKCITILSLILLFGCTYPRTNSSEIPTQNEQLCQELKRNIIFSISSGPTFGAASTAQKIEMHRLYEKYNCSKFDK